MVAAVHSDRVQLTAKQNNIYGWGWQPEARFRYAVCGRRFGKTFLLREEMRRACRFAILRRVPIENEIWYGAPSFKQAKRVFWRTLKRSIPRAWIDGKPNETECSITLKSGHVLRVVGLDNYEDLRGAGLFFFAGDEWADAKPEAWLEVISPMLSTCNGHALFIGTPKGFNHFRDGYIAGQSGGDDDTKSWLYTTLAGGNVPPAEVDKARKRLDPKTFRQEYEGSFETYAGQVYYGFNRVHCVKERAYDAALAVHVGMDFNVNPMSATVWQEVPTADGVVSWQIDEIVIPTSDTVEMCREITTRYSKKGFDPSKPDVSHITVYPDPAGAQRRTSAQGKTDLSLLADAGFTVRALQSHPLVRDRINLVNGRFESADGKRHIYVSPRCRKSIECYERLEYKEGTSEPDKTSGHDHIPDATGYYIFARFSHKPVFRANNGHMGR